MRRTGARGRRAGANGGAARQYRRIDVARLRSLAKVACRTRRSARQMVGRQGPASGRGVRRNLLVSFRKALAAFPAMGHEGGRAEAVAIRHSHPSGIWTLARLPGGPRVRRQDRAGDGAACGPCVRALSRTTLSQSLPGRRDQACVIRRLGVSFACSFAGRRRVHAVGLYRPQCLPGGGTIPLSGSTTEVSHGSLGTAVTAATRCEEIRVPPSLR